MPTAHQCDENSAVADRSWALLKGRTTDYDGKEKEEEAATILSSGIQEDPRKNAKVAATSSRLAGKLNASNISEVIQHSYLKVRNNEKTHFPHDNNSQLLEMVHEEKVFNDCIHDYIILPALCVRIIDTPEFQRLRRLKQLGVTHYVYPNATHTRFQHSLGVAHLAGEFARCIQIQNPSLVSHVDVLCLQIAGLCHDLGHGPFSHLWETFVKKLHPERKWTHEENSIKIFEKLIEKNNLWPIFVQNGLNENDLTFIKEAIGGPLGTSKDGGKKYLGRGPEKYFLYEIVANKKTGIDVDKLDYFQRDDYYLNVGTVFKYKRLPFFMKVFMVDGRNRLCIRDKEANCLSDIFTDRSRLHDRAYQHRVVHMIQLMLLDALLLAEPFIRLKGDGNSTFSEATFDLEAFQLLVDDYIFFKIMDSPDPRLLPAQNLLNRIEKRQFYSLVSEWTPTTPFFSKGFNLSKIMDTVIQVHPIPESACGLQREDFAFAYKYIDLGEGDKKRKVIFYDKNNCITNEIDIPGLKSSPSITIYVLIKKTLDKIEPSIIELTQKWLVYLEENAQSLL